MLPWFVWKEIAKYAVSQSRELCLVNKEWFKWNAGQFLTATNLMFLGYEKYHEWLKLAETLDLSDAYDFNWKLLRDYHYARSAKFSFVDGSGDKYDEVANFLKSSKIVRLSLEFDTFDRNHHSYQVLKGINKHLRSLYIFLEDLEVINYCLSEFDASNIVDFLAVGTYSSVCFSRIHQAFPNLKHLNFNFHLLVNQQALSDKLIFSKLKTLKIIYRDSDVTEEDAFFRTLFQCYFPILISFEFQVFYYHNSFEKIPLNMPNLKKLHLELSLAEVIEQGFPIEPINSLKELYFHCLEPYEGEDLNLDEDEEFEESFIELDLTKIPHLSKLDVSDNILLINSSENHYPLITCLDFGPRDFLPNQPIYDKLLKLNEVKIGCRNLAVDFTAVIKLCEIASKVTLCDLYTPIESGQLTLCHFKTNNLTLIGDNFLTGTLIHWLANQFQLDYLTIVCHCKCQNDLKPVSFPKLKKLEIVETDLTTKTYMEAIFITDPSSFS